MAFLIPERDFACNREECRVRRKDFFSAGRHISFVVGSYDHS